MNPSTNINCLAAASLVFYGALAVLTNQREVSLLMFYGLMSGLFLLYLVSAKKAANNAFKVGASILVWALLFRVVAFFSMPMLEDDFYRYLWDGFVFSSTGSPYGILPAQYFTAPLSPAASAVLDGVSYPSTASVYGPVCELVFLFCHWLAAFELWPLRSMVILADLATLWLLLRLAPALGVVLYAFNPLLIHSFAFNLHSDVFAVFFVVLSLLLFKRQHFKSMALALAFAVAAKLFALLLVPLLVVKVISLRSLIPFTKNSLVPTIVWQVLVIFFSALMLIYLPFIINGATELQGLLQMQQFWQFNAPLFSFTAQIVGFSNAKLMFLLLFLLVYGLVVKHYLLGSSMLPRGDVIFAVFFMLSAVLNPWYWVWVLVFAAIRPSLWAWSFSAAILLAYACGINLSGWSLGLYQQPAWVLALEYLSFAAVLFWTWRHSDKAVLR